MLHSANLRRFGRSLSRLARTRYPPFVFGRPMRPGEVPAFLYHDIGAAELTRDLEFLQSNGYHTLSIDEFHDLSAARRPSRAKAVLLTFDDARRNFWDVAFPILLGFGARATLFAPTYWMTAGGRPGAAGSPDVAEAPAAGRGPEGGERLDAGIGAPAGSRFMTWEQLALCRRSGLIDVEPHSHFHALVSVSLRLVGFASPAALETYDIFDWPMRREGVRDVCGAPEPGTPIYEAAPLHSCRARVLEPAAAAEACRRMVDDNGGAGFFQRADWARSLLSVHERVIANDSARREFTGEELDDLVRRDITQSISTFEHELGYRPRFFAYPWTLGSGRSLQHLRELGVSAAFGVAMDSERVRRERTPVPVHARHRGDWLRSLPGTGRRGLMHMLPGKVRGFASSQHLAH